MFKVGDIVRMVNHQSPNVLKRWGNRNLNVLACVGDKIFVEPVNNEDGLPAPIWSYSKRFNIVPKKLVVLSNKYALFKEGDVVYDYEERNGYYYIKGRRYLFSSFNEVAGDEVVKKNKKTNIDEAINKWFDKTILRMENVGKDGLCAYSMLFVDNDGKFSKRDQIVDICHARITPIENRNGTQAVAVCTDVFRKGLNENQTRYMDFILNRSHFASTFIGNKDVRTKPIAVKMDVNKGLNEIAVAAILVRTVWEHAVNADIFNMLVENGISGHVAMLFGWMRHHLKPSGSHHIFHYSVDVDVIKNWIKTGKFIDPGEPYRTSTASYRVSPAIWGSDPHMGLNNSEKGIGKWCADRASKLGAKSKNGWGEVFFNCSDEHLLKLAIEFEKEL